MEQYINKSAVVEEIERRLKELAEITRFSYETGLVDAYMIMRAFLDTLEVKVNLNNGIQLTWEDIRKLYIIFAEVDAEIELCKVDIKLETIGYYREVLKRFKAQKGE